MLNLEELEFINATIKIIEEVVVDAVKSKPYGIVHDSHEIIMCGKKGLLVWDFVIWNELTFEEIDTGVKHSLYTSIDDTKTKERFELLVKKYGI